MAFAALDTAGATPRFANRVDERDRFGPRGLRAGRAFE